MMIDKIDSHDQSIVVVTRPKPDHAGLIHALEQLGFNALHCPAFSLQAVDTGLNPQALSERIHAVDCLISVSPMASRQTLASIDCKTLAQCIIIVPGQASALSFIEHGFNPIVPAKPGTSEAILDLPELQQVSGQTIALVAAADGRRLLAETLRARGAKVVRLELYQREPLQPTLSFLQLLNQAGLANQSISMISSLKAFQLLFDRLNQVQRMRWLNSSFIVSSDRLREALQAAGAQRIQVAQSAANDDMLRSLKS